MKVIYGFFFFVYPTVFLIAVFRSVTETYNDNHTSRIIHREYIVVESDYSENKHMTFAPNVTSEAEKTVFPFAKQEFFLTLFTTFNSSMENFYVYNNTLNGWKLMKPKVLLVLFSDDVKLKQYVKNIGWDLTLDVGLKACNGTPVLKDMFRTVQTLVKSEFYAYANADILFNRGLIRTLEGVANNKNFYKKPFLIIGKRSDLLLDNHKITNIYGEKEIDKAFKRSHVSYGFAEDYFVVNNIFAWKIFPGLVIGRPMVDNYLTYIAKKNKVNVIDASATIGALHQKTKRRKRKIDNCNKEILGNLYSRRAISRGNVECSQWETKLDFDGKVFIMRRGSFTTVC